MSEKRKKVEMDLTDIRNLLKKKSIEEVQEILGIKNRQCFFKFCQKNFIKVPFLKKEMSCTQTK